ncbi:MAG: DUF58 domain-containing protein [Actinomycetota bacterium]|nr:DUF58 domain-containing protein [Actinomycetota bacterium]
MLLVCLLLLTSVVFGRADLFALAVPFVLGTAVSLFRRPVAPPRVWMQLPAHVLPEGQPMEVSVFVTADATLDVVAVFTRADRWLGVVGGEASRASWLPWGGEACFPVRVRALRWGRHLLGPVTVRASACDGLLTCLPQSTPVEGVTVLPLSEPFNAVDAVPRANGVIGAHRSRRSGEGGELAGVRPFSTGDRLRRIDWRVTLRTREMYVTATLSERDTDVVVLLDALHEVGSSGGVDGAASSLDTAVRAAGAITEHYLDTGDRVGLVEYGARLRFLPPMAGRIQVRRALDWLPQVAVWPEGADAGVRLLGPRVLPPHALLIVLTPLVDERTTTILATLAQRAQSVVAVDTMPPGVRPPPEGEWSELAWRLWQMEREAVIGRLREVGVPVVRWEGTGSLDLVLRDVSRMATSARPR